MCNIIDSMPVQTSNIDPSVCYHNKRAETETMHGEEEKEDEAEEQNGRKEQNAICK